MKNLVINVLEDGIINLKVFDEREDNKISIVKNKKVTKEFNIEEIAEDLSYEIDEKHILKLNKEKLLLKVYNKYEKRDVFSTKIGFIFETEQETGIRLDYQEDETIIGLGQDHMANLDNRNVQRNAWNQCGAYNAASNCTVPFYLSSRGYGLFIDTSYPVRMAFGTPNVPDLPAIHMIAPSPFEWEEPCCENGEDTISLLVWEDPEVDIYIMLGQYQEALNKYYELTGYPSLMPKWGYGFIQCKNRYKSAEEVLHVAKNLKDKEIPCDCLVIDWKWFEKFGDLEWDGKYYPENMKKVISEINDLGIEIMQAQHPFIDYESKFEPIFKEKDLLIDVPEGARPLFDHFHPDAKDAWWNEISRLYDDGVRGYWTDMGEPELDLPGSNSYIGEREKYHNAYTRKWSQNLYEGQTEDKGTRPFILARTMSLGIQNYNTALWNSDVFAHWNILRDSVIQNQTTSISGQPYFCTDIGGFHADKKYTPELYVRWFQWGTFCNIFRTHGTKVENEPWSQGDDTEKIVTDYINLRYKLMPYIYYLNKQMTETGVSVVRPMIFDYQDNDQVMEYPYQFMFGDILVSPVVEEGAREKTTYFPDGIWYDYHTGRKIVGGREITDLAPIDTLPMYVREGSIIVESPIEENTVDIHDEYIIKVFGEDYATAEIYEDDGKTYSFEEGNYNKIKLEKIDGKLVISTLHHGYKTEADKRELKVKLVIDKNKEMVTELEYKLGKRLEIDLDNVNKITRSTEDYKLYIDTLDRRYDGEVQANIVFINNTTEDKKLKMEVSKPKYYYIQGNYYENGLAKFANEEFTVEDFYQKKLLFTPLASKLPQCEPITIFIKDDEDEVLAKKVVYIGNCYAKQWKVAVSQKPLTDAEQYYDASDRENNAWGYVRLLSYINIKERGVNPVDFLDFSDIQNGYGRGIVTIESPEEKEVYFKLRGETTLDVTLNGEKVFTSDDFVIEELLKVKLDKGDNQVIVDLTFDSGHPYTGREFGYSLQVLDTNLNIVEDILFY